MSDRVTSLLTEVMDLPVEERLVITEHLLEDHSVREAAEEHWADPVWRAEMDRRLQSIEGGTAELIPWDEALVQIRAELARRRAERESGIRS